MFFSVCCSVSSRGGGGGGCGVSQDVYRLTRKATAFKDAKAVETGPKVHRIRITLTSRNVRNLEKGTDYGRRYGP